MIRRSERIISKHLEKIILIQKNYRRHDARHEIAIRFLLKDSEYIKFFNYLSK
tara:strand:- start:327 stop:485 length:159 start_codon:yes stop_codon:yes gene_type:complete